MKNICDREGCENECKKKHYTYCSRSCSAKVNMTNPSINTFFKNNPACDDGSYSSSKNAKLERTTLDNFTCKRCGKATLGGRSNMYGVHHIIPSKLFDRTSESLKLRDSQRNLITLCGSCHKEIEGITLMLLFELFMKDYEFETLGKLMDELREKIESGYDIDLIDLS